VQSVTFGCSQSNTRESMTTSARGGRYNPTRVNETVEVSTSPTTYILNRSHRRDGVRTATADSDATGELWAASDREARVDVYPHTCDAASPVTLSTHIHVHGPCVIRDDAQHLETKTCLWVG